MRIALIPLGLALALALGGCAPGMYMAGALPGTVVPVVSPVRDANSPFGNPYPIGYGTVPVTGRAQLPASGPFWSFAPTAPAAPVCAAPPPNWLSPPPWLHGPGSDPSSDPAGGGCTPPL